MAWSSYNLFMVRLSLLLCWNLVFPSYCTFVQVQGRVAGFAHCGTSTCSDIHNGGIEIKGAPTYVFSITLHVDNRLSIIFKSRKLDIIFLRVYSAPIFKHASSLVRYLVLNLDLVRWPDWTRYLFQGIISGMFGRFQFTGRMRSHSSHFVVSGQIRVMIRLVIVYGRLGLGLKPY